MPFLLNGITASLAPSKQHWDVEILGYDVNNRPRYSAYGEVELTFDSCDITLFKQWQDAVSAGSLITITMLDIDEIAFTAYSNVNVKIDKRPTLESAVAIGPWSIIITDVYRL